MIRSKDRTREAGPFVATQTGPADHFRLPKVVPHGPILVTKFGPARTSFGKMGPPKLVLGGPFLAAKIGPGTTSDFCMTGQGAGGCGFTLLTG